MRREKVERALLQSKELEEDDKAEIIDVAKNMEEDDEERQDQQKKEENKKKPK